MKLYFVRHGQSTANILREFANGDSFHPLTEKGVAQAHVLARDFAGMQVAQIYSSPVLRARQTAQILAESRQAPLAISEALREWNVGIYEGTTDPLGWELHRQVQEDWFTRQAYDHKMPGGESFLEIRTRFTPLIDALVQDAGRVDQNIVLVGHGGLYTAMLPVIFKNIDFSFARQHPIANTAYVIAETRPTGLYCLSWCGVALAA